MASDPAVIREKPNRMSEEKSHDGISIKNDPYQQESAVLQPSKLLNDPVIRSLADKISRDPAFTQNPEFLAMVEKLGSIFIRDTSKSHLLEDVVSLDQNGDPESKTTQVCNDPAFKKVLEEIETGGPSALLKYLTDMGLITKLLEEMVIGSENIGPSHSRQGDVKSTIDYDDSADEFSDEDVVTAVVDHEDDEDDSTLHYFASVGRLEDLETLLSSGADKDERDSEGRTALHFACGHGELKCATALLKAGATIDAVDQNLNSPLHYAASYGQCGCIELLLQKGASLTLQNIDGKTAHDLAESFNQDEASHLLGSVHHK